MRFGVTVRSRTSAKIPEEADGRDALRLSATGRRARTCGHRPSFPAVDRPLCSCCRRCDSHHQRFTLLLSLPLHLQGCKYRTPPCFVVFFFFFFRSLRSNSPHHRVERSTACRSGYRAPQGSSAGLAVDRHRRCAATFPMTTGDGCVGPCIQFSISHVAHIRATETEWHRNRSVATSRGAWLPALICMGGFARRQGRKGMIGAAAERERDTERGRVCREGARERRGGSGIWRIACLLTRPLSVWQDETSVM